jgi:outer membrane protein assembly factor BamB
MTFPETTDTTESGDAIDHALDRHDLLYAGEWQGASFSGQRMYRVARGRVVWEYELPWDGEFGDVSYLSNGHVLFARYHGATEIDEDGTVVWDHEVPPGVEVHTCQPLGLDRVFLVLNRAPALALVIDKRTNTVERRLEIPVTGTDPHGMFRHCRFTESGTFLIAHLDEGRVVEYAPDGTVVLEVSTPRPWAAVRLEDGNTLISGDAAGYLREVDPSGAVVWSFTREDAAAQGVDLFTVQQAVRLDDGNTLFANWCGGDLPTELQRATVQLVEVTPGGRIVWTLASWDDPDLGVASNIHPYAQGRDRDLMRNR